MTAAIKSRDTNRVFVCLGPAVREEESIDVARCQFCKLRAQTPAHFSGHEWICVSKRCRLLLNRTNHSLVAMTNVDAHQLAVEIDEALVFRRPEVDSLRARDRNR